VHKRTQLGYLFQHVAYLFTLCAQRGGICAAHALAVWVLTIDIIQHRITCIGLLSVPVCAVKHVHTAPVVSTKSTEYKNAAAKVNATVCTFPPSIFT
jgi:hypothetical protein